MVKAKLEDLINIIVGSSMEKHPHLLSLEALLSWGMGRGDVIT